ncbi:hypothetical protein Bbelb_101320 [Branchiostoma belcheri]|nr:hypothetical protein Bbelb_101320 [Branchiostoma belcheri]
MPPPNKSAKEASPVPPITMIDITSGHDEKAEIIKSAVKAEFIWQDQRLLWEMSENGNVDHLFFGDDQPWKPLLTLKRNADEQYTGGFPSTVIELDSSGDIHWPIETLTTTTCDLDPFLFPKDNITCPICWSAGSEHVIEYGCMHHSDKSDCDSDGDCSNGTGSSDVPRFLTCNGTVAPVSSGEWSGKVTISTDNNLACLTISLERDPSYHFATTLSPCIILVVLMVITFMLPVDKGDRISFGVTVLLSMVVSLVVVTGFLPVKGIIPFIALLIIVAMGMMALFMLATLFIVILHSKKGTLSPCARKFFLRYMARMLLMGDLSKRATKEGTSLNAERRSSLLHTRKNLPNDNSTRPEDNDVAAIVFGPPRARLHIAMKNEHRLLELQNSMHELNVNVGRLLAQADETARKPHSKHTARHQSQHTDGDPPTGWAIARQDVKINIWHAAIGDRTRGRLGDLAPIFSAPRYAGHADVSRDLSGRLSRKIPYPDDAYPTLQIGPLLGKEAELGPRETEEEPNRAEPSHPQKDTTHHNHF